MENTTLLIHTHSDYSYLWPIINDYIKNISMNKIFAYDKIPDNSVLPSNFTSYIQYDVSLNFSKRLVPILNQIDYKYILLVYDVDLIINLDENALRIYMNIIDENNIERCSTAVFNGSEQLHKENYSICNLNRPLKSLSNHYIPADCSPVIWNKNSFIKMLELFPNETYSSLELNKNVINYHKQKVKCYGIQYTSNINILYCKGATTCNVFSFLHITLKGKIMKPFEVYMDYKQIFLDIISKYNLNIDEIGTKNYQYVIDSFHALKI